MKLSFIVAMDKNRGIGQNNGLPWTMPADLKHFRVKTTGKPILMGRKTHDSIGRTLPKRPNIIITRDESYLSEGCEVYHSIHDALKNLQQYDEVMVIGGANLFAQMLEQADRLYLTIIDHEFAVDTYLPNIDLSQWKVVEQVDNKADAENPHDYCFITYDKLS
jgi:dihydrofolate reductase